MAEYKLEKILGSLVLTATGALMVISSCLPEKRKRIESQQSRPAYILTVGDVKIPLKEVNDGLRSELSYSGRYSIIGKTTNGDNVFVENYAPSEVSERK